MGSGPSQLALAILLDVTGDEALALKWHQMFKSDHVDQMTGDRWTMTEAEVLGWLRIKDAQAQTKREQYSHEPQFPKDLVPPTPGTSLIQG